MVNQEKMSSNLIATYIQAYNQSLEEIFALDPQYKVILSELKLILEAHTQNTDYTITLAAGLQEKAQQALISIYEFYSSDDVEPRHEQHYEQIIRARLQEYIAQLEKLKPVALSSYITEQQKLYAAKQARIAENFLKQKQLRDLLDSKKDKQLSESEIKELQKYKIDPRTKRPEALICIEIAKFLACLQELFNDVASLENEHAASDDNELIDFITASLFDKMATINQKYCRLIKLIFNLEVKNKEFSYLERFNLYDKFEALLSIFNASLTTHKDITSKSTDDKLTIIEHAETVVPMLANIPHNLVFDLLVPCLHIRSALLNLNCIDSANLKHLAAKHLQTKVSEVFKHNGLLDIEPESLPPLKLQTIVENTICILKHPSVDIAEFIAFDQKFKAYVLSKPNNLFELVKNHGLKFSMIANLNTEQLQAFDTKYETITKLITETDLTFDLLFARANMELVSTIIDYTYRLGAFSSSTGINASRILAPDVSIPQIYRILCNLEWLNVLINYYFISFEEILQLPCAEMNKLLDTPTEVHEYLAKKTKPVTNLQLASVLKTHLQHAHSEMQALNDNGITSHIEKIQAMPQALARDLMKAGLPFKQTREIYNYLIQIHHVFANRFINNLLGCDVKYLYQFPNELPILNMLFPTKQAAIITKLIHGYIKAHEVLLTTEYSMPSSWSSKTIYFDVFADNGLSDDSVFEAHTEILKIMFELFNFSSKSQLSVKHILLYNYILNSDMCTYFENCDSAWKRQAVRWKQHLANGMSTSDFTELLSADTQGDLCAEADTIRQIYSHMAFIKYLIEQHTSVPYSHCHVNNGLGENALHAAVANADYRETVRLLRYNPNPQLSNKGSSLMLSALLSSDREIIAVVKTHIVHQTKQALETFLATNNFKSLTDKNKDGETVFTLAIKQNRFDIIQAVIANSFVYVCGQDKIVINEALLRSNEDKETPLNLSESFAFAPNLYSEIIELSKFDRFCTNKPTNETILASCFRLPRFDLKRV